MSELKPRMSRAHIRRIAFFRRILQVLTCFLAILLLKALLPTSLSFAQTDGLTISLRRDFGYGGLGGQIQGTFSLRTEGPDDLVRVDYFIDDQLIGSATEAPWRLQFKTDDYGLGVHRLHAAGTTSSGETLASNVLTREFVPASTGWRTALMIGIPLVLIALAIPVLSYLRDRRSGAERVQGYGPWGGAVCPKCGFPYARHVWAPNVGVGKYDRCPNCKRWSVVRRATTQELLNAEGAHDLVPEEPESWTEPVESDEDKLRQRLEDSRFDST